MKKNSIGQYKDINAQTGVVDADPHRLIQMLFAGAIENIAIAKGCMQRKDIAGKGKAVGKAISILGALSDSINHEVSDGGISSNLAALYEFSISRLTEANINNSVAGLDEAAGILKELQAGWNDIRPEVLNQQSNAVETA